MNQPDTSCRKCGAAMKTAIMPKNNSPMGYMISRMKITAYRCECGHWNDLKRRKQAKP